ncbi:MAG: 5-(carboxyamino)imidazole ribonucleotide synthase [Chitinophagaceae bacterium]|nr:5-(carboxyamino)imidazole ribonucleotide synthase [Chitinophagaceae bacterium]
MNYFAYMFYHTPQKTYYVYIILCYDKTYYMGLTDDLIRRFEEHVNGIYESCYTFKRRPLTLKYYESIPFLPDAIEREAQIKGWSKAKKLALVEGNFHKLQLLSQCNNLSHYKFKNLENGLDSARPLNHPSTLRPFDFAQGSSGQARVGILGGGQLGRMLLQAAANYPVETFVMENDEHCPAAHLCHHFTKGDISNFDDVYNFGKGLDAITIEIEAVNEDALEKLEMEGVRIYPKPSTLRIIKNKILQKQFYKDSQIPTSEFVITQNRADLHQHLNFLPAAHKLALGGYDGRGVELLHTKNDLEKGFDAPAVLEKLVSIKKEISVIIAVDDLGENAIYPAVDMIFNNRLNVLEYQVSPADLPDKVLWKVEAVALKVVKDLKSPGIFAVELFVDNQDNVFVNETAPRVHNSGHHSIEANYSSQFDMLWRIMLGYPLGSTAHILPAAIVNLLGTAGHSGEAVYEGLQQILQIENVFVHIYGKKETRPGRKMGHITILSKEKQELIHQANRINQTVKVVSKPVI